MGITMFILMEDAILELRICEFTAHSNLVIKLLGFI